MTDHTLNSSLARQLVAPLPAPPNKSLQVTFTINGHLPDLQIRGNLPISEADWVDLLRLDPDYQDIAKEIKDFKSSIAMSGENMLQILT